MSMHDESMNDEGSEVDARLKSLPAERAPSREMKRRTLEAARAAGYLRAKPSRTVARSVALLAAAALIFLVGTLVGYALPRRAAPAPGTADSANHEVVALAPGFTIQSEPKRHIVWY